MSYAGRPWLVEASQWVEAVRHCADNPIFQFLQLVSKRCSARQKWYQKGVPLIIGALPVMIWGGYVVYDYLSYGTTISIADLLRYAPVVFLAVSYISWAAMGLNLAILDAMSLLRRSTKQSSRFELDDLTCATSITDREFVTGFLAHVLPQLYLRIVAGVGLGWLIMLLMSTEWLSSFSHDTRVLIALAPISIGLWSLSGCLGVTALVAFYLALGCGRSTVPASIAGLVVLGNQGMWLLMSYALVMISSTESIGSIDNSLDVYATYTSSMLAPVLIVLLIVLGLRIAFSYPVLKQVQAIGSPLLLLLLAMTTVIVLVLNTRTYASESALYICLMSYIWHFGDMLPLNFGILTYPVFYTGDLLGSDGRLMNLWYRPITIVLAQLALLYICLGYAKRAVGERRQAN